MTEANNQNIRFTILGVFIVIFIPLILYLKSDFYRSKEYLIFKNSQFDTTLSVKFDEHPVRPNKIYLHNGPELRVQRDLFDALNIGDRIIKLKNSDSIQYHTKQGIIYVDENKHLRETLLNSKK